MTQNTSVSSLTYLQNRPLTPAANFAVKLAVVLVKWAERHATRKALYRLDDYLLDDIGVSREDARKEVARPFWIE